MKRISYMVLALLFLAVPSGTGLAQKVISAPYQTPKTRYVMNRAVINGDTVLVDELPPAYVSPKYRMSKTDWRKYYKRVHNFSKAYPYALFVSEVINITDSLFEADHYTEIQKDRYLSHLKESLLEDCTELMKGLTLNQGLMMIRLIDREVGLTPYYILKTYLNSANAVFWQGVAKVLSGDLKKPYDRFGEDKDLEELCRMWADGEYRLLYVSIFGKNPPEVTIPAKYLKPLPMKENSRKGKGKKKD